MRRFDFTDEQLRAIAHDRFHHVDPREQRRMEILWLKSQGETHSRIAELAAVSRRTERLTGVCRRPTQVRQFLRTTLDYELRSNGTDRLILEGLTCRCPILASGGHAYGRNWDGEKPLFPRRGSFVRIMNCSILPEKGNAPEGWILPSEAAVPEVVNCDFPVFNIGLPAGGLARFRNSVFGYGVVEVESLKAKPAKLEIDRCAFFFPEPVSRSWNASLYYHSPVELTTTRSIFVSPTELLFHPSNTVGPWNGTANVFVKPFHFQAGIAPFELKRWQTERQTDVDSIELPPWEFDPGQRRILRDQSPGYQPRPDGTDYGADIDRLIKALAIPNAMPVSP